jgi:hypothetical protein
MGVVSSINANMLENSDLHYKHAKILRSLMDPRTILITTLLIITLLITSLLTTTLIIIDSTYNWFY